MLELASAVEAANVAFYRAFDGRDLDGMDALWARDVDVVCIHPGAAPLRGRSRVMESWRRILLSDGAPRVSPMSATVTLAGTMAFVVCHERVRERDGGGEGLLVATNVFVREGERWCIAHHHASPTAELSIRTPRSNLN